MLVHVHTDTMHVLLRVFNSHILRGKVMGDGDVGGDNPYEESRIPQFFISPQSSWHVEVIRPNQA